MTSNIDEIEKKALKLDPQDRALLIRQLLSSLDDGVEEEKFDEMWIKETKYRYNQLNTGKTSEKSADKVFHDVKESLK
jgi:hypothetical protein